MANAYMRTRRRKTTRRRKSYRKRVWKSKGTRKYARPDGYHSEKIVYNQNLVQRAAGGGSTDFYFTWLKALPNAGTFGVNQSVAGAGNADKQFQQCATVYREYKVTGVSVRYTPRYSVEPGFIIGSIKSGSKQYTAQEVVVPNPQDIRGAFDEKTYNPMQPFKRYYNVSRWAKSKDIGWQTCLDIISNPPRNIPAYDMVTGIYLDISTGIPVNRLIGDLQITYYVKFRGRTAADYQG